MKRGGGDRRPVLLIVAVRFVLQSCGMSPDLFIHLPDLIHVLAFVGCGGNEPCNELELLVCHNVHVLSSLIFKRLALLTMIIIAYSMEYVNGFL